MRRPFLAIALAAWPWVSGCANYNPPYLSDPYFQDPGPRPNELPVPNVALPLEKYSIGNALLILGTDGSGTLQFASGATLLLSRMNDAQKRDYAQETDHRVFDALRPDVSLLELPRVVAQRAIAERQTNQPGDALAFARWLLDEGQMTIRPLDASSRQPESIELSAWDRQQLRNALGT